MYHGLSIAWGKGFKKVVNKFDSYLAMKLLPKGNDVGHPLFGLVCGVLEIASDGALRFLG